MRRRERREGGRVGYGGEGEGREGESRAGEGRAGRERTTLHTPLQIPD